MLSVLCVLVAACAPSKQVAVEDVPKLTKLDDVMDAQAATADPQFRKAKQESFSDTDYAGFADTARHIKATSTKLKDFTKGPEFDTLSAQLGEQASKLLAAAEAKDAAGSRTALTEMKQVCKTCHSKFK
jgi:cytochrome c556